MAPSSDKIIVLLLWDLSWIANTKPMTQFERVTNVVGFFFHERTVNDNSILLILFQSKQNQEDNAGKKEIQIFYPPQQSTDLSSENWKLILASGVFAYCRQKKNEESIFIHPLHCQEMYQQKNVSDIAEFLFSLVVRELESWRMKQNMNFVQICHCYWISSAEMTFALKRNSIFSEIDRQERCTRATLYLFAIHLMAFSHTQAAVGCVSAG